MRIALFGSCLLIVGCSAAGSTDVQVRLLDDIAVMSPADVLAMRSTIPEGLEVSSNQGSGTSGQEIESSGAEDGSSDENVQSDSTVPQNVDDRPAELKLFEAYANFKSCIEDAGETIRGNLQDPTNPAFQDPAYAELIQTCAARSKIIDALRETAQARGDLSPDEVRTRNEAFKSLSECLKKRGWTIETRVDEKGLINPSRFESPDGTLDQRDLDQCLSETGIADAANAGG
jgi:hypothetical protein